MQRSVMKGTVAREIVHREHGLPDMFNQHTLLEK